MTTTTKYSTAFWNTSKRGLYALQVMVLALAIPVLSYVEITHQPKNKNETDKITNRILPATHEAIAKTRLTTKNLNGFTADTSMASICSVTFIEPSSAPMLEPTFPAAISAVTNGANALMIAMATNEGSQELAPNSARDGRDCFVNTKPVTKPVKVIKGSDLYPTA